MERVKKMQRKRDKHRVLERERQRVERERRESKTNRVRAKDEEKERQTECLRERVGERDDCVIEDNLKKIQR